MGGVVIGVESEGAELSWGSGADSDQSANMDSQDSQQLRSDIFIVDPIL
jgi:hypothetical protein